MAQFDEMSKIWVEKMALPQNEKDLRAEMISYMAEKLNEIKRPETLPESKEELLLLLTALGLLYKAVYIDVVNLYFYRYVREVGGKGVSMFSKAWLKAHMDEFAAYKHDTDPFAIARTEIGAIGGLAELDGYYQRGYRRKKWISERDSRVRLTHRIADSQIKLLEEPFVVGGSLMMFPQDTSLGAPAEEIANCRCTMSPVK